MPKERKLVLQNGTELVGEAFGADQECIAQLVFNTSMVGYQELLSDPACSDQMVVMTYPLIGNYGIIDEDYQSKLFGPKALIVREYNDKPSNFRYTKTLNELLEENNIPGITHLDTRKLTNILRIQNTMLAMICDSEVPVELALKKMAEYQEPRQAVARVSCKKKWYSRCANPSYNVVAVDCGITYEPIRTMNQNGCNVTIVPYNTSAQTILDMKPDGIFISDGPGNPQEATEVIELIRQLQGKKPIFAVSLGHQLVALANGLKTEKMRIGHRGGNHPVVCHKTGKVTIVSQNHGYVVSHEGLALTNIKVSHTNLLDETIEGLEISQDDVFSVQYHPDATSSPLDSAYLFEQFVSMMQEKKGI